MSELANRLDQELEKLKEKRDELRVQLDLGKKDLHAAWEEAEEKWSHLEAQLHRLKREGEQAAEDIGEAADLLIGEIKQGFQRIRELI